MADGFAENAEFFTLTYEDRDQIERGRRFEALAPVLWLMAGGIGERIEKPVDDWSLPDKAVYGVLFNDDKWRDFVDAVMARQDTVTHIFAATESTATFQQMLTELPSRIKATQLYSQYLDTFEINTKGRS
jgi:adenine-specific DNA-methyltransferase